MLALPWSLATFGLAATIAWFGRSTVLGFWLEPWTDLYQELSWRPPPFSISSRGELSLIILTAVLVTLPVVHAEAWMRFCQASHRRRALRLTIPFVLVSCGAWWLAFICTQRIGLVAFSSLHQFVEL